MGHRHQNSTPGTNDSMWLTALIDTFERTEELGSIPCDEKTVSATMSRLRGQSVGQRSGTTSSDRQRRRQATLELHH